MASLKERINEKVHRRDITVCTYKTPDQQIIVEGSLVDNQLIDTFHYSGNTRTPDTIHHLIVRILVDEKLTIQQVETEMPRTPHDECPETINCLQALKGMKIRRGFTMKVKELFGNGQGCSHLSELIISMAPAAIQGYWTAFTSAPLPEDLKETMKLLLVNTCWVWRSGGPVLKSLGEEI